jgi:SIR2-like domain
MEFWPDSLVSDLIDRKVFIVIGAGVSKNSLSLDGTRRPPSWLEFLQAGIEKIGSQGTRHIQSAIKNGDYLHACEWIKKKLDEHWTPFLNEQFLNPRFQPAEIHDLIFRLDQRIVATPNIDDIYDRFVVAQTSGQTRIKSFADPDAVGFLREKSDYVLKLHGNISAPANIIFTQQDYAQKLTLYSTFYSLLDAAVLSHTFLFIGCGLTDPDVALLLENVNFRFVGMPPHYMITSSRISDDMKMSLRSNRNLKCLLYRPDNNHAELKDRMLELVTILDAHKSNPGPQQA